MNCLGRTGSRWMRPVRPVGGTPLLNRVAKHIDLGHVKLGGDVGKLPFCNCFMSAMRACATKYQTTSPKLLGAIISPKRINLRCSRRLGWLTGHLRHARPSIRFHLFAFGRINPQRWELPDQLVTRALQNSACRDGLLLPVCPNVTDTSTVSRTHVHDRNLAEGSRSEP